MRLDHKCSVQNPFHPQSLLSARQLKATLRLDPKSPVPSPPHPSVPSVCKAPESILNFMLYTEKLGSPSPATPPSAAAHHHCMSHYWFLGLPPSCQSSSQDHVSGHKCSPHFSRKGSFHFTSSLWWGSKWNANVFPPLWRLSPPFPGAKRNMFFWLWI